MDAFLHLDLLLALLVLLNLGGIARAYVPKSQLPQCVNANPGYTCGKAGHPKANAPPADNVFHNVTTIDACRIELLQLAGNYNNPKGDSLAYNSKLQSCSLYEESAKNLGFVAAASAPQIFYDKQCFACLKSCPPDSFEDNLLVNPDFDAPTASGQNNASPWNDDGSVSGGETYPSVSIANKGYNSPTSLDCFQGSCAYTQFMDLCLGSLYSLTFQYRLESISSQTAHFEIQAGDWYIFYDPLVPSDHNEWLPFYASFVARITNTDYPDYSTVFLNFKVWDDQYTQIFIDNMQVRFTKHIVPPASAKTVLANGGFESGKIAPFRADTAYNGFISSPPIIVSPGHSSKHGVSCKPKSTCGLISQPLSLQRYSIYVLSFAYKRTGSLCNADSHDYDTGGIGFQLNQPDHYLDANTTVPTMN